MSGLSRCVALALLLAGCGTRHVDLVSDPSPDSAAPDAASGRDAESGTSDPRDAEPAPPDAAPQPADAGPHQPSARCGGRACACDDGSDNDGDGLSDGLDPECTGAFDEDEASFGIGKPNKQGGCRDCFWDSNAGSGDDGCRYPAECLVGAAPGGNGNCSSCQVGQACLDSCQGRTPNGCDCFGCCDVLRPGGERVSIELGESCDLSRLDDLDRCPRCVRDTTCANPCGRCELCLGKRASDLPADCQASSPGQPSHACDDGLRVCATSSDCSGASYCLLGCCLIDLF